MRTVLASAYDINPYKGSESGTGWNFTLQLARFNKVVAITRENNKADIERYIAEHNINSDNLKFSYYDLPYYLRFWKRGARGSFLYYNLWQLFLPIFVLRKKLKFDVTHHINFHADHVPSFLWLLGKPFIWGPINHNEPVPKQYLHGKIELLKDRSKFFIKWLRWNLDPTLLLCRSKAVVIIGSNTSVMDRLHIRPERFRKVSTVSAKPARLQSADANEKFSILSVGRQVPIKSFDISILAFNKFYSCLADADKANVELLLVGDGSLSESLLSLSKTLECIQGVKFIKWVEQKELDTIYSSASVMLVPSHEGAGAVVAEGLSFGLPVVCFDNHGAGEIVDQTCGIIVSYDSFEKSYEDIGRELHSLYTERDKLNRLSNGAIRKFEKNLSWDCKGNQISDIYNEFLN